jgi:CelD/BcsL family acetyltransferase involved in cellulose biosynthesis
LDIDFDPGAVISATMGRQGGEMLMLRAMVLESSHAGTGRDLRATGQPMSDMSTTLTQAALPGEAHAFFLSLKRAAVAAAKGR